MLATTPAAGAATMPRPSSGAPAWSIMSTPNAGRDQFAGVSCTSASACTAVGNYVNSAFNQVTLAERWNGKAWTIQATPNPVSDENYLYGVSCTSASVCTAAGYYDDPTTGNGVTMVQRWNGKAWAVQPTPTILGDSVGFSGVSCTSASACTAVGSYGNVDGSGGTMAERWNGTTWVMQSIPNPNGTGVLTGVSCTSAYACTAVGYYGGYVTLAERWNGKAWVVQTTPNPSGATESFLEGVSCTSASVCTAAGSAAPGGTLAERYRPSS
jgi:hypothetical protein